MLTHGAKVFHLHLLSHVVELGDILFLEISNVDLLAIRVLQCGKILTVFLHISRKTGRKIAAAFATTSTALLRPALGIVICRSRHGLYEVNQTINPAPENWHPASIQWDYLLETKPRTPLGKLIWEWKTRG